MCLKKNKPFIILLLLIAFVTLPRLLAAGTVTNVRTGATYPTIQAGVDEASSGDTLNIAFGTYTGRVVIRTDGIILEGGGAGRTFLNLSGVGGTAVTFENVTGSTVRGLTIRKADVGIRSWQSKPQVANNIFIANKSAFENYASYSQVINNSFYRNTRAVFSNSSSTLTNNIIAGSERYGIAGFGSGSITYNLFDGNALGNYSGVAELPATNIVESPLFVSAGDDFHLLTNSPAIDAGDPDAFYNDAVDGTISDIGVYGGPNADVTPAIVGGVAAASATDKATLSWNKNLAYNISGYKIYYGTSSKNYPSSVSAGDVNSFDLTAAALTPETRYYFSLVAVDNNSHEGPDSAEVFGAIDNTKPPAPQNLDADIGDKRLYLRWDAVNDAESGTKGYKIYYDTTPGAYGNSLDVGDVTSYELTGLSNDITYYIAVSAIDNAGNEGDKSSEVNETPQEIRGIMGLKNTGGCFIATAAYGSYEAPYVKILREFRDKYLISNLKFQISSFKFDIPNFLGRGFVKFYYQVSPPIADFIRESETLRSIVRIALLPVIGLAWMVLNCPLSAKFCVVLIVISGILLMLRHRGIRPSALTLTWGYISRLTIISLLAFNFSLLAPTVSSGDEKTGVTFSLSYGQLAPVSDEWKDIYGDKPVSNLRAAIGYEFHPTIGAEIGVGYLAKKGKGRTITGRDTNVEASFRSAPVDITVLYRLNYLHEQLIIPYVGGGVTYNLYWEDIKDGHAIKGGMWGHHATGGIQLLMDELDSGSAWNLKEDYGIENTYLIIGATHSVINDFGEEDVDLGGWNYSAGLVFEF